jgi:hypothetical protein
LNECIYENEHSFESMRRRTLWPIDRRQSLLLSDDLLRRWIEGIDVPPSRENDLHPQSSKDQVLSEPHQGPHISPGTGLDSGTDFQIHECDGRDPATTAPDQEEPISHKSSVPFLISNEPVNQPIAQAWTMSSTPDDATPDDVIFKSFRVKVDDPCYKVLPAAVQKHSDTLSVRGVPLDWRHYALYIVYGDQERAIGLEEKPLTLFKNLEKGGKRPTFMLRYIAPSEPKSYLSCYIDAVHSEKEPEPCDPIPQTLSTQTVANPGARDHSSPTATENRMIQVFPRGP